MDSFDSRISRAKRPTDLVLDEFIHAGVNHALAQADTETRALTEAEALALVANARLPSTWTGRALSRYVLYHPNEPHELAG
jgi:hypothetical protein